MSATGSYITQADVESRFTAALIAQIYDDGGDGTFATTEEAALTDIILDAENLVEEAIRKTYGEDGLTWLRGESTDAPRSIKRRCLDAVRLYIAERHPDYIRIDVERGWERFNNDLDRLKLREVEMAVIGDPEPAVVDGGIVRSGDPDDTTVRDKVFLDTTGIF